MIAIGIAVVSLWEFPKLPSSIQASDKLIHGLMYLLLSIAMIIPFDRSLRTRVLPYIYMCIAATAYGALIEVLQHFCTVSRTGSLCDLCADFVGALIGLLIVFVITKKS
ncbi:MAG: VanZ family protein [Paludibacteraceae bacterium]|nr:VanZ family protein [Paludibacteraceae bacterium]